jgi:hypothetical protein
LTGEQAGGGLTPVVRVGETIRRAAGPWTPAVHALLDHLAAVALYSDDDCVRLEIRPRPRAPRIHAFCGAYGIDATAGLLDLVERRVRALYDSARIWGEAGAPGWSDVWRATRGEQWLRSLRFVEQHRHEWVR